MRPTLSLRQLGLELDRVEGLAYDLVKTYVRLPIEYQRRAIAAVHRLGLQLSSHYLYPAEHLGMDGMEHTGATNRLGYSHTVSRLGRAYADVITLFTKAGLSVTPTLFNSTMAHVDDPSLLTDRRTTTLYPAWEYTALRAEVDTAAGPAGVTTRALLGGNVDMVLRIHRGGGFVISGTDSPLDNIAVSLHANLRSMVAGGFTPYEALTTATRNPARWLNLEDKLGVVRAGAQADLSFVRGNPLADIRAAAAVEQVMVAGSCTPSTNSWSPTCPPVAHPAQASRSALRRPASSREQAHARDPQYWWHEPEWLHRVCCERLERQFGLGRGVGGVYAVEEAADGFAVVDALDGGGEEAGDRADLEFGEAVGARDGVGADDFGDRRVGAKAFDRLAREQPWVVATAASVQPRSFSRSRSSMMEPPVAISSSRMIARLPATSPTIASITTRSSASRCLLPAATGSPSSRANWVAVFALPRSGLTTTVLVRSAERKWSASTPIAVRWSTGTEKNPCTCGACSAIVSTRSTPAATSRSATSRPPIEIREASFLSERA